MGRGQPGALPKARRDAGRDRIGVRVFAGNPRIAPDWKHSAREARFLAIGRTEEGRPAFVVFTMRGDRIRPLSARYTHAKETAQYDKT